MGLDPARAFPNVGRPLPTACRIVTAILIFPSFSSLFSTFEHLTVSRTWPLPGISVRFPLPRGVGARGETPLLGLHLWTHTSHHLHCTQTHVYVTTEMRVRCVVQTETSVHSRLPAAWHSGFFAPLHSGVLAARHIVDANEVPSARAKRATKLRTPA